jgi:hypothetical protein
MAKLIPIAVIAAVATLGACSVKQPPQTGGPSQPQSNIVTQVYPYMAGNGVVQAVTPTPVYSAPGAATGSTSEPMQRLEIRMDNGKIQYVDVPSREFTRGTRVTLSEDKIIRRSS